MNPGIWALPLLVAQAGSSWSLQSTVSFLAQGCSLVERSTGMLPAPTAIFLECRGERFLVLHPLNLVGHVRIGNPQQALDFVRFFTNERTNSLVTLEGRVEVVPDSVEGVRGFNQIDSALFRQRLPTAEAQPMDLSPAPLTSNAAEIPARRYLIKRPMIFPDNSIREVRETVWENGYYEFNGATMLFRDAGAIGLLYLAVD